MFVYKIDEEVSLALVQPSFAMTYFDIVARERDYLSTWLAWPPHADGEAFFSAFITSSLKGYAEGKSMTCAMVYKGQVVGNVSFNTIDKSLKKATVGYWLSKDFQGNGITSRCVASLVDMAFNQLELTKVEIAAATGNAPSRRLCERLGFTLEGIITQAENLNDRIVDHAIYGLAKDG
ncbi:GNAT family N-acetyltransferase [Enterovibrio coralii]|uniref:Ribosomal-protein-L7/L12-serine acetyltransferase n=1 Tax=Enterovibrio coralii TaxID=294935 RepID=A0A135I5Q2_9GAMM|nr:GNAT family protein [Enterovibrio coralii]KXF80778.1 ribosomal-protein-L7/L12-serine acetyltransferase [Enterovibrio coralii]